MRDGWETVPLGQVTTQVIDPIPIAHDKTYSNLGLRMYAGGVFEREAKSGAQIKASRLFRVRSGQFIYNRLFAGGGSFGLVRPEHEHGVVSNEFPVFDLDPNRLLPEYLYLHFQQPSTWETVAEQCIGTTQTRLRWKEDRFRAYPVALPPLDEQRRIVDLIGALDDAIAAAGASQASVVRSYVSLAAALPGDLTPLGDLLTGIEVGRSPSGEDRVPRAGERAVLKLSAVGPDGFVPDEVKVVDSSVDLPPGSVISAGDVLMVRASGALSRVGAVCRVPNDFPSLYLCDKTFRLVPRDGVLDPDWMLGALQTSAARADLESRTTGSHMRNISQKAVRQVGIPYSDIGTQRDFGAALRELMNVRSAGIELVAHLRALRSNLLTALLSGEHEIPESYDEVMEATA